jgi:periplasmic protein TonB
MKSLSNYILFFIFVALICIRANGQQDTVRIYIIVPQMPTFPGNLDNYMDDHLQYPHAAKSMAIRGAVNVTFVISQTGVISNVTILTSVSPSLDSEAVRVVKNMPPWNPGMKDGKPVRVQFNLPVYFQLTGQPTGQWVTYQPIDTVFNPRNGVYVEPYIGLGKGGPNSSTATILNTALNMKFGFGISYMFPSGFGITSGLQVQQYKFNYSYNPDGKLNIEYYEYNNIPTALRASSNDSTVTAGYGATISYSFLYAQLPILIHYISSQENRLGFYAEAGLIINYPASSQISGVVTQTQYQLSQPANTNVYYYSSTSTNTESVNMPSQDPSKLTLSGHAAAGLLIPVTTKISIVIDVSSDIGLMNAGIGSKDVVDFGNSKFYLYGIGNYGTYNSIMGEVKLLIKMSGASKPIRKN